jgi:apolipoprotein D and lipocalin family protein
VYKISITKFPLERCCVPLTVENKFVLIWRSFLAGIASLALVSCASLPDGIEPVANFNLREYLGKWYEIARLDHPFERGLEQVTAEYSLRDDGGIKVVNRGFSAPKGKWKKIEGRALPAGSPDVGHLKVSFFGPFFGAYGIFELDPRGQYAFVCGPNRNYLWLLARKPAVSEKVWERFVARASELGFDTSKLIRVKQG